ncbi:GNAT family N-acetyltransferase [Sphingobium algorifonticola]|uniref:GNAT family N-acetyltransferase n=1 Tax=Sphingobium algorifonticola TaxID=2008318 RepID=A0A437J837_9SPHN|nr:GNAT family N-acetyltransferase [Sphingobium algorifonticola]RVT41679.1 GNAT family N-acetyltransferase [Sphingobium algorifonticola]
MPLAATFSALPDLASLGQRWQALEARSAPGTSIFLGWTWMESWLSTSGARPELLAITADGADVALALMGRAMMSRPLGAVASLSLNQAGVAAQDRGFIEYNGLLTAADAPEDVAACAMHACLARNDWRVLRLAGVAPDSPLLGPLPGAPRLRRRVRIDESPAYFIDLAAVRAAGGDYLSLLSANTRSQIKRSFKDHGAGQAAIEVAPDGATASAWLAEMAALNVGRHVDNAWDDPLFRAFAQALVQRGLTTGQVELLRIAIGDTLLGYLLNFRHADRAMNYQSAFTAPISPKTKPGLMCHAAAVARYADAGLSVYSLLAGKDRYKQSLATGHETLEWWNLERFSPRLEAEALLRTVLRRPASA